jgi:hypothetical protein
MRVRPIIGKPETRLEIFTELNSKKTGLSAQFGTPLPLTWIRPTIVSAAAHGALCIVWCIAATGSTHRTGANCL